MAHDFGLLWLSKEGVAAGFNPGSKFKCLAILGYLVGAIPMLDQGLRPGCGFVFGRVAVSASKKLWLCRY